LKRHGDGFAKASGRHSPEAQNVDHRVILPSVSLNSPPLPSVDLIQPRLAKPFHRDGWVYEEKYDGWRIVALKDGHRVRLVSRTGRDHAVRFPQIASQIAALPAPTLIFDGEVCCFDEKLVSRFCLPSEPDGHAVATPPVFVAFDCLHVGSQDLRPRPLVDRRRALEELSAADRLSPGATLRFPPAMLGKRCDLWQSTATMGRLCAELCAERGRDGREIGLRARNGSFAKTGVK
jgi:ATP-dependent DNA ligase